MTTGRINQVTPCTGARLFCRQGDRHLAKPSRPFSTSVGTKMAQRKQMPEVGIRVAYREPTPTQGRIPIAFPSLQLSGTVKHASMTNGSGDAIFTVCQLAGFSPRHRHTHTPTSPHSDWVELIQLPSSITFARLAWHDAGSTSNQIAFARPGSSSGQEWSRTKQHRTGSKAESRANLCHFPCPQ